jgi:hypothetical protein
LRDLAQGQAETTDSQGCGGVGLKVHRIQVMRNIFLVSVFAVGTFLVTGAIAQHEGHQQGTPPAESPVAMPMTGMMGEMMPMMAAHAEAAKMVDQLVNGFAAIENEKDAKVRSEELAAHGKLLKELQAKLQGQSQLMEHMHGMMMGRSRPMQDKKQ